MAVGPAIMALGVLWYCRLPASSDAWSFGTSAGKHLLPPGSYVVDLLPGLILFGIGLMIMVAPLTTAVMTSVPEHNSGVASAINNAISRVGPQLAGALIFVAIAASFYHGLETRVPGLDASSAGLRKQVAPLNQPESHVRVRLRGGGQVTGDELIEPSKQASTHSFHLAMLIGAALLLAGAMVNAVGIRNPERTGGEPPPEEHEGEPAVSGPGSAPTGQGHPSQPPST
jgi:hypothetical protein